MVNNFLETVDTKSDLRSEIRE
jgi:hypothetical protein